MPKKLTQEEFIAKAVAVHGVGRYDYSRAVYENAKTKVEVICFTHGVFEQLSSAHLGGQGCPKCGHVNSGSTKRSTQIAFLEKAKAKHGVGTYDYSRVVYTGNHQKVEIICPVHGVFKQSAGSHLQGMGCPECASQNRGLKRRVSAEEFIARAQQVHGEKYDYSQLAYSRLMNKITLICPWHGSFSQRAVDHLKSGCAKCGGRAPLDTVSFIEKAHAVHGNKYDYSQVIYKIAASKVRIVCPKHGAFEQTPSGHLGGAGCSLCAGNIIGSTTKFLLGAKQIHGDLYDYSNTYYTAAHTKVKVGCSVHGEFEQTPNAHVRGQGCPQCAKVKKRAGWLAHANGKVATLYLLRIFSDEEEFYKVGITIGTVTSRYNSVRDMPRPYQYEVLAEHKSANTAAVYEWEQSIIETFVHIAYRPNIHFGGASECFSAGDEILSIFPL